MRESDWSSDVCSSDLKRMVDQLVQGTTTRIRNQTAGYITRTVVLKENQHIDEGLVVEDTSEE
jgi:ribosomal protein S17E